LFNRLDRRGKGLLNALIARLAASSDLLSTASLDLVMTRLQPAVYAAREKSGRFGVHLVPRIPQGAPDLFINKLAIGSCSKPPI